ncbi:BTAD domain-containing putative transcriptional regulator [Streptomyces sp. G-G2]|uniref:AfsR/SARP family transcriptional regulator n=1 Tax=Streptomyces sp. G-G2 TaxID=3046201 RepID=UPI0024BB5F18|nr:BTAD domain-containing putative transcriptional regulator [Streptomyces sp. G-G2]MDJ0382044.1 BTAD domain-containing putative transcriptional regulator [Streptomyces sp. G-G2]
MSGTLPEPRFSLLGSVQAHRGVVPLPLGPPQQRALLAMLLYRRNAVVGLDELIDGLWDGQPPRAAVGTVRSYVYRLRRTLGAGLATQGPGYTLQIGRDALDLARFEDLVTRSRAVAAAGDAAAARDLLARALGMWPGTALAGLPGPQARIQRESLTELRLSVLTERIELDVRLGHHARLVAELTGLCLEHPLNDRLRILRDTALERSGRGREARSAPPASAPAVSLPSGAAAAAVRLPVPAQLPYVPGDFTGREHEVRSLLGTFTRAAPEAMAIAVIGGIGGVGKTTLAVHAAQRLRERFPDGQLYANLRGVREDPAEPDAVLGAFLRALGVVGPSLPDEPEERAALYRSRLAGQRMLLVLDDVRDAAQLTPLLPGTPSCAVLVTSRGALPEIPAAVRLRLDVLPAAEALVLLGRIVGEGRTAAEPAEAAALVERCRGLPLALRIAGSRLAARPAWRLADFVRLLDGSRPDAPGGTAPEDSVEACFRLGYDLLGEAEARLLRLLAVPRAETVHLTAAAALAGLERPETARHLERLTSLGLLESPAPFTYRFHDLIKEFAGARSAECDGPGETAESLLRLMDHILACARYAYAVERPGHPLVGLLTPTVADGVPLVPRVGGGKALAPHIEAVLAVAAQVLEASPSAVGLIADAVLALDPPLDGSFLWPAVVAPARRVLRVAEERGEVRAAGRAGYMLGAALTRLGRLEEAERVLAGAGRAARSVADEVVRTEILTCRAVVRQAGADWAAAEVLYREAIALGTACGNAWGTASARSNSVSTLLNLHRFDEAAEACRLSLAAARESGDRYGEAHAVYSLGIVARHTGAVDEAVARHRESAELGVRGGYPALEVMNLISQTTAQLAGSRTREAVACGERALAAARLLGWRAAEARALRLLGTALAAAGEHDRAEARLTEALEQLGALGLPEAARASAALAALRAATGR